MHPTLTSNRQILPAPWGCLSPRMRLLFISGPHRTGRWLAEALAADSATEVDLQQVVGVAEAMSRLRDEIFDAVLVSHADGELDALDLLDAIHAGSSDEQPIIVLGEQPEKELTALCYESGADAYMCLTNTTIRHLIWELARAVQRREIASDNRSFKQENRHRLDRERNEALRLLNEQRQLIAPKSQDEVSEQSEFSADHEAIDLTNISEPLVQNYRELLRAYIVMGSGNLSDEMQQLAESLASSSVSARQAVYLHLQVLEDAVRGLGNRSARHVMSRADLLILEVLINLAEFDRRSTSPALAQETG